MTDEALLPSLTGRPSPAVSLALVGYMGAGKTTVGRALAERTGWRFDDLDELIERREGRRVEQIFEQRGESAFRELENSLLRDCLRHSGPAVLALGGGAFIQPEIQRLLAEASIPTVFLDAPVEELFRRCLEPGMVRPLRGDVEQFRRLYEHRRPTYLRARLAVTTLGKAVEEIVEEILARLNLVPLLGVGD
jgi:shikimate kinase